MELDGTLAGRGASRGGRTTAVGGRSTVRGLSLRSLTTLTWIIVLVALVALIAALSTAGPQPGGVVSGQGSFASGPGAYTSDPSLGGPAQFTLEASCQAGGRSPQGRATLAVPAADFTFESSECNWVALVGGSVKMAGTGTVNGKTGYEFMLIASDGSGGDGFHLTVWDQSTDAIVYDNEPSVAVGHAYPLAPNLIGGSIDIKR